MGWLNDLLKDYPALSVAKERLALIEDKLKIAEEEIVNLKRKNETLHAQIPSAPKNKDYFEFRGVLWKEYNGDIEQLAYCPDCQRALSAFPPGSNEILICSKCNFTAPFQPKEVAALAKKLQNDLLSV